MKPGYLVGHTDFMDGCSHAESGSPEMVAASLGPFYESDDAARHLNVSVAEIKRLATCAEVLAVTTGDGTQVYPTWQFTDGGTTLPGLVPVLTRATQRGRRVDSGDLAERTLRATRRQVSRGSPPSDARLSRRLQTGCGGGRPLGNLNAHGEMWSLGRSAQSEAASTGGIRSRPKMDEYLTPRDDIRLHVKSHAEEPHIGPPG